MPDVVIVDDQPLIRSAIRGLLDADPEVTVVGEAGDGVEALEVIAATRPDVVLMDIRMPRLDGIRTTAALCADDRFTDTRVLVLTTFEEDGYVVAALRAGASGFIGKGAEPEDIPRAVRAIHDGEALLSPAATRALIEKYLTVSRAADQEPGGHTGPPLETLTAREREVLELVARGRSNQELAAELVISPLTVKTHVNRIMTKIGAHDRAQVVIYAYESGLVVPSPPQG